MQMISEKRHLEIFIIWCQLSHFRLQFNIKFSDSLTLLNWISFFCHFDTTLSDVRSHPMCWHILRNLRFSHFIQIISKFFNPYFHCQLVSSFIGAFFCQIFNSKIGIFLLKFANSTSIPRENEKRKSSSDDNITHETQSQFISSQKMMRTLSKYEIWYQILRDLGELEQKCNYIFMTFYWITNPIAAEKNIIELKSIWVLVDVESLILFLPNVRNI